MDEDLDVKGVLGRNLRFYRKQFSDAKGKPYSQQSLAKAAGVSWGTIQKLESGFSWPDWKTIISVSNALSISPFDLFANMSKVDPVQALKIIANNLNVQVDISDRALKPYFESKKFYQLLKKDMDNLNTRDLKPVNLTHKFVRFFRVCMNLTELKIAEQIGMELDQYLELEENPLKMEGKILGKYLEFVDEFSQEYLSNLFYMFSDADLSRQFKAAQVLEELNKKVAEL